MPIALHSWWQYLLLDDTIWRKRGDISIAKYSIVFIFFSDMKIKSSFITANKIKGTLLLLPFCPYPLPGRYFFICTFSFLNVYNCIKQGWKSGLPVFVELSAALAKYGNDEKWITIQCSVCVLYVCVGMQAHSFSFVKSLLCDEITLHSFLAYLTNHSIPCSIDLLSMFTIGYQIKIIGELHKLGNFFKNINTKPFATFLDIGSLFICFVSRERQQHIILQNKNMLNL